VRLKRLVASVVLRRNVPPSSKEARERFLSFALSSAASWAGNFRDLNTAVARMATRAPGGRISTQVLDEETSRLSAAWHTPDIPHHRDELERLLTAEQLKEFDLFDRAQLAFVIDVCKSSRSLSEAGRTLFGASGTRKSWSNGADRLRSTWRDSVWSFQEFRRQLSSGLSGRLKVQPLVIREHRLAVKPHLSIDHNCDVAALL
jgi:sigma54-dependent transcription regulator